MKVLGVTGSYASGKTTACRYLEKKGCQIFNADTQAARLMKKDGKAYLKVRKLLGDSFLTKDAAFDRKKIAEFVFARPAILKRLNAILHPLVYKQCQDFLRHCLQRDVACVVLDVPLLLEAKFDRLCDVVVTLYASRDSVYRRAKPRKISKKQINAILRTQMPLNQKKKRSDYVVNNNGDLKQLYRKIEHIFNEVHPINRKGNKRI